MRTTMITAITVVLALTFSTYASAAGEAKPEQRPAITKEEMVKFVEEAAEYVKKLGKEAAFKEFSNPKGSFVREDGQLYIYAYDFNCVCLAHGFTPGLVGKDLTEHKDAKGLLVIQKLRDTVKKDGKGFLEFYWTNPATGKEEAKLGYVVKIDDGAWLGSGIYTGTK